MNKLCILFNFEMYIILAVNNNLYGYNKKIQKIPKGTYTYFRGKLILIGKLFAHL